MRVLLPGAQAWGSARLRRGRQQSQVRMVGGGVGEVVCRGRAAARCRGVSWPWEEDRGRRPGGERELGGRGGLTTESFWRGCFREDLEDITIND